MIHAFVFYEGAGKTARQTLPAVLTQFLPERLKDNFLPEMLTKKKLLLLSNRPHQIKNFITNNFIITKSHTSFLQIKKWLKKSGRQPDNFSAGKNRLFRKLKKTEAMTFLFYP